MDVRDNAPLIAAAGGLLLFISLFLDWFEFGSAWEFMDIVDVILALLALVALGVGAMLVTGNSVNLPRTPGSIVTTAGIVAFSIVATFLLEGDDLEFGIYLAIIGTVGMIVGGTQLARGATPAAPRTRVSEPPSTPPPPPPPPSGRPTV